MAKYSELQVYCDGVLLIFYSFYACFATL